MPIQGPKFFKFFLGKLHALFTRGRVSEETTFAVLHRPLRRLTAGEAQAALPHGAGSRRDVWLTIGLCDEEGRVDKTPSALLGEGMEQQQLGTGQPEPACGEAGAEARSAAGRSQFPSPKAGS